VELLAYEVISRKSSLAIEQLAVETFNTLTYVCLATCRWRSWNHWGTHISFNSMESFQIHTVWATTLSQVCGLFIPPSPQ